MHPAQNARSPWVIRILFIALSNISWEERRRKNKITSDTILSAVALNVIYVWALTDHTIQHTLSPPYGISYHHTIIKMEWMNTTNKNKKKCSSRTVLLFFFLSRHLFTSVSLNIVCTTIFIGTPWIYGFLTTLPIKCLKMNTHSLRAVVCVCECERYFFI